MQIPPVTLKPEFFHSFCIKIIVAERSPNQDTAKGVIDRAFIHSCFKGYPQYDIKEILNPTNTGGPEHKSLLLYRLIHFKDEIKDVDIGVIGRDKELVKPTLQLFQKSQSQDQLVKTFQKIPDLKNKKTALHAALLSVVSSIITNKALIAATTADGKIKVYASDFWLELPLHIQGQQDDKKPGEYHSIEFATLYKGTIGRILHDNFGIDSEHTKKGSLLTIDCPTITILESQLNNKIVVKDPAVTVVTTVTAIEEGGTIIMIKIVIINRKKSIKITQTPSFESRHCYHIHHRVASAASL